GIWEEWRSPEGEGLQNRRPIAIDANMSRFAGTHLASDRAAQLVARPFCAPSGAALVTLPQRRRTPHARPKQPLRPWQFGAPPDSSRYGGAQQVCVASDGASSPPPRRTSKLEQLWKAYIQLTQAEAAFRIQKDQLNVRPIWHQREDRVQAHI